MHKTYYTMSDSCFANIYTFELFVLCFVEDIRR